MRLIRQTAGGPIGPVVRPAQKVDLPADRSPIVLFGLMFFAAVGAGYAATRLFEPVTYPLIVVTAIGGGAAAFLAFVIPSQTLLFLRKAALRLRIVAARGRLRHQLDVLYHSLLERLTGAEPGHDLLNDVAVTAHLRGADESARQDLARVLESSPDDPATLNNLGAVLASAGQYDEAARLFARAQMRDPKPETSVNMALVAPLVQDPSPLRAADLTESSPDQALAMNNMGVLMMKLGDLDQAREWFLRATRLNPRHGHAWANLGLVSYHRERLREAAGQLVKAARFSPGDPRITNNLAVVFAAVGKARWSQQLLVAAQALEPANIGIRINTLNVHAQEGHVDLAVRGLRALANAAYHRADALYNLGVLDIASGDYEGAADFAARGISAGDRSAEAFTNLAVALWYLERAAEALSHFQSARQAPDAGPHAFSNLGRALLLEGRLRDAVDVLEQGRERWRSDGDLALDLATALLALAAERYRVDMPANERREFFADLHRSHAGLEAAISDPERQSRPSEALVNMGLYLYLREEFVKAAEYFEKTVLTSTQAVELHHLAGTAYGRAADRERTTLLDGARIMDAEGVALARKAVPHLEKACEERDALADSFYNMGRVLYATANYEKALEYLRKGLRVEDSEEMNHLAALAAGKEARECLNAMRGQSLMSESRKEALTRRSHQYMDAAVQYFRQALLKNEQNPTLHANIGLAYMLRNREHDVESAIRHWQRMRQIAGDRMARRYSTLTQVQSAEHAARVQFDDSDVSCRDVRVVDWISTLPPAPTGLRYVMEPVSVQDDWRLVAHDPRLAGALQLKDRISGLQRALSRLG